MCSFLDFPKILIKTAVGLVVTASNLANKTIGIKTVTATDLSLDRIDAANYVLAAGATATDDTEITGQ